MEFEVFHSRDGFFKFSVYFFFRAFAFPEKIKKHLSVFDDGFNCFKSLNPFLVAFQLFKRGFRLDGIIPKVGV